MLRFLSGSVIAIALFVVLNIGKGPEKRILFIGSSFTYGGDIPVQVKNIAITSTPSVTYHVEMVVRGGTSLEQHLAETDALATIQEGQWDFVVLQDTSVMSFRPEWLDSMNRAATVLAAAAHDQGAEVLYFAHWAPNMQAHDTSGAIRTIEATYDQLAQVTGGRVAPAGRLWQLADDAGLNGLYSADAHHASVKGAYAAALAITEALGDADVQSSTWAPDGVPEREQNILRAAASSLMGSD